MTLRVSAVWLFALLFALLTPACIKVPERVKLNFCAQPRQQNHFGSGAASNSCCRGMPRPLRFGTETGPCRR